MPSFFKENPENNQLKQDILDIISKETHARQSHDTRAVLRQIIHSHDPKKYYFYTEQVDGQLKIQRSEQEPKEGCFASINHANGTVWVDTAGHPLKADAQFAVSQYIDSCINANYWKKATSGLKVLGGIGENKAVDMVIFVGSGSVIKANVMTITRKSVNRFGPNKSLVEEIALPGGFQESQVVESQRLEVLEELFSNGLLDNDVVLKSIEDHVTSQQAQDAIYEVFSHLGCDTLKPQFQQHDLAHSKDVVAYIKQWLEGAWGEVHGEADTAGKFSECSVEKLEQIKSGVAVALYRATPLYDQFTDLLPTTQIGTFKNETDPRNTEVSHMASSVGTLFLDLNQHDALEKAGLELSGGDDAVAANMIPILELLGRDNVFSDHKRFICEAILTYPLSNEDLKTLKEVVTKAYHDACSLDHLEQQPSSMPGASQS